MIFERMDLRTGWVQEMLKLVAQTWAGRGELVGLTSGVFDLPHEKHLLYLQRCAAQCDHLIVCVDADDLVKTMKGPKRPYYDQQARARMIAAMKPVRFVVIQDDYQVELVQMAKIFNPIMLKNERFKEVEVAGAEFCKKLVILPDLPVIGSTTQAVESILAAGEVTKPTVGSA